MLLFDFIVFLVYYVNFGLLVSGSPGSLDRFVAPRIFLSPVPYTISPIISYSSDFLYSRMFLQVVSSVQMFNWSQIERH